MLILFSICFAVRALFSWHATAGSTESMKASVIYKADAPRFLTSVVGLTVRWEDQKIQVIKAGGHCWAKVSSGSQGDLVVYRGRAWTVNTCLILQPPLHTHTNGQIELKPCNYHTQIRALTFISGRKWHDRCCQPNLPLASPVSVPLSVS